MDQVVRAILDRGWRQGSVYLPEEGDDIWQFASKETNRDDGAVLVVVSHDCDVANAKIDTEPRVELLCFRPTGRASASSQFSYCRHPRFLELAVSLCGESQVIRANVHDRWFAPREVLASRTPSERLDDVSRRHIAQWLAKRYTRAAYPSAFDRRWVGQVKEPWISYLSEKNDEIAGVYLEVVPLAEISPEETYECNFIIAIDTAVRRRPNWNSFRDSIKIQVKKLWEPAHGVALHDVDVLGVDEVSLEMIANFQRFDADWISMAEEGPVAPIVSL